MLGRFQFRRLLAQINGIELDEAKKEVWPREQAARIARRSQDKVATTFYNSMANSLKKGHTISKAHKKAFEDVANKHGPDTLVDLHGHVSDLGYTRYTLGDHLNKRTDI
jgi:hypothetical protein